jgi:hypothetical protein
MPINMTLPELNTKGVDVSNTLYKLAEQNRQAKLDEENTAYRGLQTQNLQEEMANRKVIQPLNNALLQHQVNARVREEESAVRDDTVRAFRWAGLSEDPTELEQNYNIVKTHVESSKLGNLMRPDYFRDPTTAKIDVGKTREYLTKVADIVSGKAPAKGDREKVIIQNPNHNPNIPDSYNNAPGIETTMEESAGKWKRIPELDRPTTSAFDKDEREEARLRLAERNTAATEKRLRNIESKGDKPEYKPGQALEKMTRLAALKNSIINGKPIDIAMALLANRPELAGQTITDPTAKAALLADIDTTYNYVKDFAPKDAQNRPTPTPPAPPVIDKKSRPPLTSFKGG